MGLLWVIIIMGFRSSLEATAPTRAVVCEHRDTPDLYLKPMQTCNSVEIIRLQMFTNA